MCPPKLYIQKRQKVWGHRTYTLLMNFNIYSVGQQYSGVAIQVSSHQFCQNLLFFSETEVAKAQTSREREPSCYDVVNFFFHVVLR
jgi:hypothetical protein